MCSSCFHTCMLLVGGPSLKKAENQQLARGPAHEHALLDTEPVPRVVKPARHWVQGDFGEDASPPKLQKPLAQGWHVVPGGLVPYPTLQTVQECGIDRGTAPQQCLGWFSCFCVLIRFLRAWLHPLAACAGRGEAHIEQEHEHQVQQLKRLTVASGRACIARPGGCQGSSARDAGLVGVANCSSCRVEALITCEAASPTGAGRALGGHR